MKFFNKTELKQISFILVVLFIVAYANLLISQRRGRDSIRKNDISAIQGLLDTYLQKYRMYPLSTADGKIIGCFENGPLVDKKTGSPTNAIPCIWGQSRFEDKNFLPRDPSFEKGASYRYVSDGRNYYIYISLEGKDEAEYSLVIKNENLQCGTRICNYKRGS